MRATIFGVKARLTMERNRRCRGSSRLIIEPRELRDGGIYLGKRDTGRDRTEDLRMPAREVHIIE